jgi:hypothetical protein
MLQHSSRILLVLALFAVAALAQEPQLDRPKREPRLPDGRLQSEAILKADYQQNLKDLDEMTGLIEAIKKDLEQNTHHVLSIKSLKQLEEIERLSRRVRSRIKRF